LYQRFSQAANRCRVLEKTCRGLLEANVSANDHSFTNVSDVLGDGSPLSIAQQASIAPQNIVPILQAPQASLSFQSSTAGNLTNSPQPPTGLHSAAGSQRIVDNRSASALAAQYYAKREQAVQEMLGENTLSVAVDPESRATRAMNAVRTGSNHYGSQHRAAPRQAQPRHVSTARMPSSRVEHKVLPSASGAHHAAPSPSQSGSARTSSNQGSRHGPVATAIPRYESAPGMPRSQHTSALEPPQPAPTRQYPRPLPPTDTFLQLLRRQRQQKLPNELN